MTYLSDDELYDELNDEKEPFPFKSDIKTLIGNFPITQDIIHDLKIILDKGLSTEAVLLIYRKNYIIDKQPSSPGNVLSSELNDGIRRYIDQMLVDPQLRDFVVSRSNVKAKYFNYLMYSFHRANICRNAHGDLYQEEEVRHILNFNRFLSSALAHGDFEAVSHILKFESNQEIKSPHHIYWLAIELEFEIHENIYKRDKISKDPYDYLMNLKWRRGNALQYILDTDFREKTLLKYGHVLFEELFSNDYGIHRQAPQGLVSKLINMGVDWYAGVAATSNSPLARINFEHRSHDPLRDLDNFFKIKSTNRELAKAIFLAQPLDLKERLCKEMGRGPDLFRFTQDPEILPFLSPKLRREFLSNDLSI